MLYIDVRGGIAAIRAVIPDSETENVVAYVTGSYDRDRGTWMLGQEKRMQLKQLQAALEQFAIAYNKDRRRIELDMGVGDFLYWVNERFPLVEVPIANLVGISRQKE